jgi:hypothetical protein
MRVTVVWARVATMAGLALTVLAAASPGTAAKPGADGAYTIANYPVEARAKDAVTAKDKAIADGQKAAFRSLLKRIVPVTAYRDIDRLGPVDPSTLIDGVAVRSERNSATEYIANLDFSFQAAEVRNLLTSRGIPFVDSQAPQTTLVMLVRDPEAATGAQGEFRAATGTWATVWPTLDLQNSVSPLKIEPLRPEIGADVLRGLYDNSSASVLTLAAAYGTDQVVIAIADAEADGGKLGVLLAGQDAAGPFALKRGYRLSEGDLAYTLELAAVVSQGILEGRWKAVNHGGGASQPSDPGPSATGFNPDGYGAASGGEEVSFDAQYSGPREWDSMRRVLLEAPGIDDIRIGSESPGRTSVSLRYPGGGPALAQALAAYGLSLEDSGGLWIMRTRR